jgi:hypothetical protein
MSVALEDVVFVVDRLISVMPGPAGWTMLIAAACIVYVAVARMQRTLKKPPAPPSGIERHV